MVYAKCVGNEPIDWKNRLQHKQISQFADDAENWGTWPEAHIDYECERSLDGYPLDELMYNLNVLFGIAVRNNEKAIADHLFSLIKYRALQLSHNEEMIRLLHNY